jgi:hypothetical protein
MFCQNVQAAEGKRPDRGATSQPWFVSSAMVRVFTNHILTFLIFVL